MNHLFDGWDAWQGEIAHRANGALVSDRAGRTTAYAIEGLQPRGELFVAPGEEVYEGWWWGRTPAPTTSTSTSPRRRSSPTCGPPGSDDAVRLVPPRIMNLEQALEFIREDELVEVTPHSFRLRKRILPANRRK